MTGMQLEERRIEPDELCKIWFAAKSNDIGNLEEVIEKVNPPTWQLEISLMAALSVAAGQGHLELSRYLLERGAKIDSYLVGEVLGVGSIPMTDLLREFGWDVNSLSPVALAYVNF